MSTRGSRAGMTLVECLLALLLASLVSAAVVSVLATQNRLLRSLTASAADAEAVRVTAGVLREELRWIDPSLDVRSIGGDSVVLRVFRGGGRVCALVGDEITIDYEGFRLPAIDKDSVLLQTGGAERVYAILAVTPTTCGAAPAVRVRIDSSAAPGAYALVFESGIYYVRDRAFRYRSGDAGRQPLTEERFASGAHTIQPAGDGSAALARLRWPGARSPTMLRVPFLNALP